MAQSDPSNPEAERSRFDLGVLLVHGIGESRYGETLTGWGQALLGCIQDWLGRVGMDTRIVRAQLDDRGSMEEPPHAEVRLRPPVGKEPRLAGAEWDASRRWLLAESWWAKSFPAPSYRELVAWSLGILPWTFASHFDRGFRRALYRLMGQPSSLPGKLYHLLGCVVEFLRLLGALLLLPLLQVLLLLVAVVGTVPGSLRSLAIGLQRMLSAYIGDSFMLVGNEVAAGAIYERVRRDLAWLAQRCDRVAIVAHSQGAAIAHQVLRSHPRSRCDLLITFGSGLRKLSEIRLAQRAESGRAPLLLAIAGTWVLGWGVGGAVWFPFLVGHDRRLAVVVAAAGLLTIFLATRAWRRGASISIEQKEQASTDRQTFDTRFRLDRRTRWIDVYASADLVPNGPLLDSLLPDAMESYEVHNRASALSDHTTYLKSRDGFVWGTANALLSTTGFEWSEVEADGATVPGDLERRAANVRRAWRVRWLWLLHRLTLVGALSLLVAWALRVPARLASALAEIHRWSAKVPLLGDLLDPWPPVGLASFAGLVLLTTGFLAVRAVGDALWAWWDGVESKRALGGRPARWWEPPGLLLIVFWLAVCEWLVRAVFPAAAPIPWSLAILLALFLGSWLFEGLGTAGIVDHLRSRVGAGDARRMLEVWSRVEENRLRREGDAGHLEAWLELGWRKQERATRESRSPEELERALSEAEALYERALDAGDATAGWYLGPLRELRLRRFQESDRGRARGGAAAGSSSAREHALREAVIEAYRRAVQTRGSDPGLRLPLARHLQQQGDDGWRQAEEVLRAGADSGDAQCGLELARLLRQRGRVEEAREALERVVASGAAEPHLELGRLAEHGGDPVSAAAHYRQALTAGAPAAAESLSRLLIAAGRGGEAAEVLAEGIELGDADAALALGRLHLKRGDKDAARAAFQRVFTLTSSPWQVDQATAALARQCAHEGNAEEAEQVYLDSAARRRSAWAAFELGQLRRRRGDLEAAASAFRLALEMARARQELWTAMQAARALADLPEGGDGGVALGDLARDDPDAARSLGDLRLEQGDLDQARAAFRQAMETATAERPWSGAPAAAQLAELLFGAERKQEAEEVLATALERFGAVGAHEVGLLREDQADAGSAIRAYRRCLRLSRRGDEALAPFAVQGLVRVFTQRGRFARAERLLRAGIEALRAPDLAIDLGRLLADGGETDAAMEAFRLAVDLGRAAGNPSARAVLLWAGLLETSGSPLDVDALLSRYVDEMGSDVAYDLGALRERHGRLDEALEAYRRAAELATAEDGDPAGALIAQGEIHRRRGESDRAEPLFLLAAKVSPSPWAARRLATLREETGRYDGAIEAYRQAAQLARAEADEREATEAALGLAALYRRQGDHRRAVAVLADVLGAHRSARCALRLAELQVELGRRDEAIEAYRLTIEISTAQHDEWQEEEARLALAELLASMGELERAVETLTPSSGGAGDAFSARSGLQSARLHKRLGDDEAALRAYRSALDRPPAESASRDTYSTVEATSEAVSLLLELSRDEEADRLIELAAERLDDAALVDLARCLEEDAALRALDLYLRVLDGAGPVADRERSALAAARLLSRRDQADRAAEVLSTAVEELGSSSAALAAARLAKGAGDLEAARDGFSTARTLAERNGESEVVGEAMIGLAEIEDEAGHAAESRALLDQAGEELATAATLLELGRQLRRRGDTVAALRTLERAVELARAGDDRWLKERALQSLATLARESGDEDRELAALRQAVAETQSARAAVEVGERLTLRGETRDAVEAFELALRHARQHGSRWDAERAVLALVPLLVDRGERQRAMLVLWRTAVSLRSASAARKLSALLAGAGLAEASARWRERADDLASAGLRADS